MCKAMEDLMARSEASGQEKTRIKFITLIQNMTADGMVDQIPRIATEPEYCEAMFKKYNIE